ncbi:MAG: glycosyl transferase [Salinarimonadaceae bacterium]|nr:MAG: glycosyl transferase [Salinarimonadaceae bacterium]
MMTPLAAAWIVSTALSAGLVLLLMPLLRVYALARPNARSSHEQPTPQGGGIAVVAAALVTPLATLVMLGAPPAPALYASLAVAVILLAAIGAWDDIRPLPPGPRLIAQGACVTLLVVATPLAAPILPEGWPAGIEIAFAVLAGLWFVNLVNFMDGLDWITVAQMVPATAALALFGAAGVIDPLSALVAASLCGGLVGFAVFNKPVARLFLGDVGSLPIGLLVAWLLYVLAGQGHLVAALLIPLYSCADATITLVRRLLRRERIWEAHRTHFYQRATDRGFSAMQVSAHVFAANVALAGLAAATILAPGALVQGLALVAGATIVGLVLIRFAGSPFWRAHA